MGTAWYENDLVSSIVSAYPHRAPAGSDILSCLEGGRAGRGTIGVDMR
jgi:hypothetical protein